MKEKLKRTANVFALVALCVVFGIAAVACTGNEDPPDKDPIPPVKVSDGIDFEVAAGKSKNLTVADYITENDYTAAASSDSQNVTVAVSEGLLTVTGVSEGAATVTLSCEDVAVTFGVTVYTAYTVTVDGKATEVKKGGTFVLPAAPAVADPNKEFDYWLVGEEHKAPGDSITVNGNVEVTSVAKRKAAVKVKDGEPVATPIGSVVKKKVSDYITAYGATVTATSGDADKVSADIDGDEIVFTPIAEGTATVTVSCGDIEISFAVTVTPASVVTYKVTVDGEEVATVAAGGTYVLPAAPADIDSDFDFVGWNVGGEVKQPGDTITVNGDVTVTRKTERKAAAKVKDGITVKLATTGASAVRTITVSDYIATHGNAVSAQSKNTATATVSVDNGVLTITAVAAGDTEVELICGTVTVTFTVNVVVQSVDPPVFANGAISFDLFERSSGSYEFEITPPQGTNFTYSYAVAPSAGVTVSGDTLTYTATEAVEVVLTVDVTATDADKGTASTSFTVTVNVTDTTPTAKQAAVTAPNVVDLYGAHTIDLAANINNANHVTSYKVNNAAVSGTIFEITGEYNDEPASVTFDVEAVIEGKASVTYTYTVRVIDSTDYRVKNGSFDNGLTDWTRSVEGLGDVNNATLYWNERVPFNAVGQFFNAYTELKVDDATVAMSGNEGAKGTLTSSSFKVGGSGWITYRFGGAKRNDLVYLEIIESGTNEVLDRFGNDQFDETNFGGCKLTEYKADLSAHDGKTVYIRITDNSSANYGLFFADEFVTFYAQEPAAGAVATSHKDLVYCVANGGFENGNHDGWTLTRSEGSDGDFAAVTNDSKYFAGDYGKDGDWLFSGAAGGNNGNNPDGMEKYMGVLRSDNFILKSNTWISFKLGGGKHDYIGIRIVKADGTVLVSFNNKEMATAEGSLVQYVYKFTGMTEDVECYVELFDTGNDGEGGWHLLTADSIVTYYAQAPVLTDAKTAIPQ